MAFAKSLLCLLLIISLLRFSGCAYVLPTTRMKSLMKHENLGSFQASMKSHHLEHERNIIKRKMVDVELEDYPGSGANNRHTPRPQFTGCVDC